MAAAVEVESLVKDFPVVGSGLSRLRAPFARPRTRVLEGLTFSVEAGEVFGLLGPNGAGKTTLLKVLATLLEPTQGRASLCGQDVAGASAGARRCLGYCPGLERSFYLRLSAVENLRFYGALNNLSPALLAARIPALLGSLGLEEASRQPLQTFSTGMLQRLAVARALLHEPRVLLLDEPTRSLDPSATAWLQNYLRAELAERGGCAVLLATHNLAEAEAVCDRLGLLHEGRLRALGTPREICRLASAASLAQAFERLVGAPAASELVQV